MQSALNEAETKQIIQNILDRQQQTKFQDNSCLLLNSKTTCDSLSAASLVPTAESAAQCSLNITETKVTEIPTQNDAESMTALGDECEWESLMKGPTTFVSPSTKNTDVAEQSANLVLSESPNI